MPRKSSIEKLGVLPQVIDIWCGGKKTIAEVTDTINAQLKEAGIAATLSNSAIARVISEQKTKLETLRTQVTTSKIMHEVFADTPATETTEAMMLQLLDKLNVQLQLLDFDDIADPLQLLTITDKIANTQLKLATARTQAINVLEKAKAELSEKLKEEITNDTALLRRLLKIIEKAQIK